MSIPTAALWIGTYPTTGAAPGSGEGIWRAGLDPSGTFTGAELVAPVAAPSFLALDPSGRTLVAVTETEPGTVTTFHVSDAGALTRAASGPSGGASPCHVVATGAAAWVANYGDGVAARLSLGPDGELGAARTHPHAGSGPVPDRQEGAHAHFVHPWGDRVLVCDLGTDELRSYPLDGSGPAEGTVAAVLPPGAGPRHLVELADGTILVAGELDCRLHVLVPAGPGRLEHAGSVAITTRTLPDGAAGYPSHITVVGDLVHVGVRGPDVLSVLRVRAAGAAETPSAPGSGPARGAQEAGHLTIENVADVDLGAGAWPRHHAVLADGEVVVVAAQNTDELIAVRLDRASGKGEITGRLELPAPACVLVA
ncbi:lactonase family protein [Promicromonospora sp. NPDC050880]|uniref:lactonase family protein n=1 Tax=Promicromonospora sp. NPDC050880 TaxID=3364406 RepID=UPI0037A87FD1